MSDGFLVRFAGTLIEVCNASEKLKKFCRDYIEEPFATPDFSVSLTADNFSDEVLELHEKVSEKLPLYGAFLFHGSSIMYGDRNVIFTAPSGTGKSTLADEWKQEFSDEVKYVNDDKPFIRVKDNVPYVCGSPWTGKHRRGNNTEARLNCICLIEQSETNEVEKMAAASAFPRMLMQTYRPKDKKAMEKTLELLKCVLHTGEFYSVKCNMDDDVAMVIKNGIFGEDGQ